MLFVLTEDAAEQVSLPAPTPYAQRALGRLLTNYLDGHHVVLIEPRTCLTLEEAAFLSGEQRAAARKIRNRYADYGALTDAVSSYVQVVADGEFPIMNDRVWSVPLRWLADHPLSETNLLCEDLNDVGVLKAAAEDYLYIRKLLAFSIRASGQQGGGGNTHRTLEEIALNRQELCVCVVDSDKKSPDDQLGPTAHPCATLQGAGLYKVEVTDGRSIENSIPWRLIDLVRPLRAPLPSEELALFERRKPQTSKYLNFKRGISGYEICQLDGQRRVFWDAAGASCVGARTCCPGDCAAPEQPRCAYRMHEGFGGSLLNDALTWLKSNQTPTRSGKYLPSPNDTDWVRLGEVIAAYTLGLARRRL